MTDKLVGLRAMVEAAKKGTDDLGDSITEAMRAAMRRAEEMADAVRRYTDLEKSLQVRLDAGSNPALKRYLETQLKIAENGMKGLGTASLQRMAQLVFERDRIGELTKAYEQLDGHLRSKTLPTYQGLTQAALTLSEEERARLPLIISETNGLAMMIQRSREYAAEIINNQLPARRRMELQIQRQLDIGRREVLEARQALAQHKITRAQEEAIERQYTDLDEALSQQRQATVAAEGRVFRDAFLQSAEAMASAGINALVYSRNIGQAVLAALKATLASLAQSAAIHAIEEVATGYAWLSAWPVPRPDLAAMAFTSAKFWGVVAGVSLAGAMAIPGPSAAGGGTVAGPSAFVSGAERVAGPAGLRPALAPGAASAAAAASQQQPPPIIINIEGDYLATPHSAAKLAEILTYAVEH
jgi:hypothetical protein